MRAHLANTLCDIMVDTGATDNILNSDDLQRILDESPNPLACSNLHNFYATGVGGRIQLTHKAHLPLYSNGRLAGYFTFYASPAVPAGKLIMGIPLTSIATITERINSKHHLILGTHRLPQAERTRGPLKILLQADSTDTPDTLAFVQDSAATAVIQPLTAAWIRIKRPINTPDNATFVADDSPAGRVTPLTVPRQLIRANPNSDDLYVHVNNVSTSTVKIPDTFTVTLSRVDQTQLRNYCERPDEVDTQDKPESSPHTPKPMPDDTEPSATTEVETTQEHYADFRSTNSPNDPWSAVSLHPSLTAAQQQSFRDMCNQYPELPRDKRYKDGEHKLPPFRIKLIDDQPIHVQQRPLPQAFKDKVEQLVDDMETAEVIEPSQSPYSFPLVLAPKKNGELRPCIDYRQLNLKTVKDVYPLPRIDDTLDALHGAKYFTCLDLKSGYWQVPIAPEDRPKTAFTVPRGHFQFRVMPFGLTNAPSEFQRQMDRILADLKWKFCMVYLDDIIIFSKSWDEHIRHCEKVFDRLQKHGLTIQVPKCKFGQLEVEYLGHIVSNGTVKPDPKKVEAIHKLQPPQSPKEIQQFLGMVGYYRKFIPRFAELARPLYELAAIDARRKAFKDAVKKQELQSQTQPTDETGQQQKPKPLPSPPKPFVMGMDELKAFFALRDSLQNDATLHCPDPTHPFIIHCDASDYAIGAVLSQKTADDNERPITYLSRVLNKAERNYDTTQKECLAATWAMKKWRSYLLGREFTVYSDHAALQWLMHTKEAPNQRLARWILSLQEYNFKIHHRKGSENVVADYLSRTSKPAPQVFTFQLHLHRPDADASSPPSTIGANHVRMTLTRATTVGIHALTRASTRADTKATESLQRQRQHRRPRQQTKNNSDTLPQPPTTETHEEDEHMYTAPTDVDTPTPQLPAQQSNSVDDTDFTNHQSFLGAQQTDELAAATLAHHAGDTVKPHLLTLINAHKLVVTPSGIVARLNPDAEYIPYIPEALRSTLMSLAHGVRGAGHYGETTMRETLAKIAYWPNMRTDLSNFVSNCVGCALAKARPNANQPTKLTLPVPSHPMETIGMDLLWLPKSRRGFQYLCVFTDYLTRWVEAVPIRDKTPEAVAQAFLEVVFPRHALPRTILSDCGKEFLTGMMAEVYKIMGISKLNTTPYHPQCNGLTERFNRSFLELLGSYRDIQEDWDEQLSHLLLAYRTHTTRTTRSSPFYALYGRHPVLPAHLLTGYTTLTSYMDYDDYLLNHVRQMQLTWQHAKRELDAANDRRLRENTSSPLRTFSVGQFVAALIPEGKIEDRLSRKGRGYWDGPFTVTRVFNPSSYEIQGTGLNNTKVTDIRRSWSGYLKPYTPAVPDATRILQAQRIARHRHDERATRLMLTAEHRSKYTDLYAPETAPTAIRP